MHSNSALSGRQSGRRGLAMAVALLLAGLGWHMPVTAKAASVPVPRLGSRVVQVASKFTFTRLPAPTGTTVRSAAGQPLVPDPATRARAKASPVGSAVPTMALRRSAAAAGPTPAAAGGGPFSLLSNADNPVPVEPPDTQLAAGPAYLLEMDNVMVGIFGKDGSLVSKKTQAAFFSIPVPYEPTDPRVVFDRSSQRFFATELGFDLGGNAGSGSSIVFLAVSATSDPRGAWTTYQAHVDPTSVCDYPVVGYSSDKVTFTCNEFSNVNVNPPTYHGITTVVTAKSDLLAGTTLHQAILGPDLSRFGAVPASSLSSTATQFMVYNDADPNLWQKMGGPTLGVMALTGVPPAVSVFQDDPSIFGTNAAPAAVQPGTTNLIDTGDDRILGAVWQNGTLWASATDACASPARSCLRLVQGDTSGWVPGTSGHVAIGHDSDIYDPGGSHLYYPAVTTDPAGNVYVAFTQSAAAMFPSLAAVALSACGGGLSGSVLEYGSHSYGGSRWGDYSSAVPDALDPSRTWITGELTASTGDWLTATGEVVNSIPDTNRPYTGGHDAIGVSAPSRDAYFAEGYTGANFDEYITVQNPGAAQALTADYLLGNGAVISKQYNLPANSRTTLLANAEVGSCENVSAHLHAANPFVAERPMYFDFAGITGGHDAVGAQSLSGNFYFAEGYTGPGFTEYLTLANPDPNSDSIVDLTYFFPGAGTKTVRHTVPAHSRATVLVNDPAEAGPNQEVSTQVHVASGPNILAERPMYFTYQGKWTGGHDVIGATGLSKHLDLAEGFAASNFDEYLTVLNPNSSTANLTITYNLVGGGTQSVSMVVPAGSRGTRLVNADFPGSAGSPVEQSVHVDSDQPVVVERPMYFRYGPGGWDGGHDAVAVDDSALATSYSFAEGYVAPNFTEYLTILNNGSATANYTITYFLEGGGTKVVTIPNVPGHSRTTHLVNQDFPTGPTAQSVKIASDQPVLVERPMYFSY